MKKYYIFGMNMTILNIVSILLFIIMFLITLIFIDINLNEKDMFLVFDLMIPYFILHELLHALSYWLHGTKWKNITFGANLEKGVLCCLCKQNVSKLNILISLIYPLTFIGVITYIIGIYFNNVILVLLSIMNISGAAGDITMFIALSRIKNFEYSEFDDPTSFGIYTNEDLSNKKLFGLKYIETKNKLDIKDYKKVNISKFSLIVFIIILLLAVIFEFMI